MSDQAPEVKPAPDAHPAQEPARHVKNGKHDVWTHRLVVVILGIVVLGSLLDMTVLQGMGKEIPSAITTIASTAIGPLAMALGHIMGRN